MSRPCPYILPFIALALAPGCGTARELEAGAPPPALVRRGFELAGELACARCHAGAPAASSEAPRLTDAGARLTPAGLRTALERPGHAPTGARMPDCLTDLGGRERGRAVAALTHFLSSLGGPVAQGAVELEAGALERGRQLYHGVGCVACHPPYERPETLARPLWEFEDAFMPAERPASAAREDELASLALRHLSGRTTLAALASYLEDPLRVHPAGRMPAFGLSRQEAADLASYLLFEEAVEQGAVLAEGSGLVLEYFEASFDQELPDYDALVPVRRASVSSFFEGLERREEDFGFRFRGFVRVPESGVHGFATTSDDGSMLYVDGALVVDNRGEHASTRASGEIRLEAGRHAFELTYFEHWGGDELAVSWSGPGFEERPLGFDSLSYLRVCLPDPSGPFALDAALVGEGRRLYGELGCAACHLLDGLVSPAAPALSARRATRGCLTEEPPRGAPRFALEPDERQALVAALRAATPPELPSPRERLEGQLARLGCLACHARGEQGGPDAGRRRYFQVERELDLGDEGRLPPRLDRAGAKLRPAWLEAVLLEGERSRPYMKTRMPRFGPANVEPLLALFQEVDGPLRDEREPDFSVDAVEAGKRLVGTKGLGCIQCHEFAGHPSLGIPAVDLARVHERVYPGWFRELLMDPIAINMNTRMPTFWTDGKSPVDVLEHDPARQVDAIWTYLSLGSSMPVPEGLLPREEEYEVEVTDRPVCVGVFMEGVSPRTVAVGYPERVHVAFDVQDSRLAFAWRGRFLNARGTWHARAGQMEEPAGEDVLEFPPGPPFAVLEEPDDPWPSATGKEAGYRVIGRGYLGGRPVFRYALPAFAIDERPVPVLKPGGGTLLRWFDCRSTEQRRAGRGEPAGGGSTEKLYQRVALGEVFRQEGAGTWLVEGKDRLRITGLPETAFVIDAGNGRSELRFRVGDWRARPVDMSFDEPWTAVTSYGIEYSW